MMPPRFPVVASLATWLLGSILATGARPQPHPPSDDPWKAQVRALRVLPDSIHLSDAREQQRVVVLAELENGTVRDVTAEVTWHIPGGLARREADRVLPTKDGRGQLTVSLGKHEGTATLAVQNAKQRRSIDFRHDVIPTLTRAGCNSGGCHGAAAGKNGFRLSLFGYDPIADYTRLTRELRGRRINRAAPEQSLLLRKPTTSVAHKGGKRLDPKGPLYRTLREWIATDAPPPNADSPELTGIRIEPAELVLGSANQEVRLVVQAKYADGTDRDVTELALLSSSNPGTAQLVAEGERLDPATAGRIRTGIPGEAFVMARFGTFAVVSQVLVVDPKAKPKWPTDAQRPTENPVDTAIHRKLRRLRLAPGTVCSDSEFVRRTHLDLIGRLPTVARTRTFLADPSKDKRAKLVDELLDRPGFDDVQSLQWAEMLRIESQRLEPKGVTHYTRWLRKAFRDRRGVDEIVRELLTARGGHFDAPPAGFFVVERDPKLLAESVAQNFLGVRIQCAQCHNHPFERWTMDDYYGFGAFFAQVTSKIGEDPRERVVFHRGRGELRNARTGSNAKPRFLGGSEPKIKERADRRQTLVDWLVKDPRFAENFANRAFAQVFGRGLVDPTDDVRVSNPPSHPGLLKTLGQRLAKSGFDLRALLREMCLSRTYQLSSRIDKGVRPPASAFARAGVRRLSAEQLLDAIDEVTGVPTKHRGLPLGASAARVENGRTEERFLGLFGRPARQSSCTCERRNEPTLGQVLHLMNGETIHGKIRDKRGRLHRLLRSETEDTAIQDELWLAAYSRPPFDHERKRVQDLLGASEDRAEAWTDVFWAVLNSKEFLFRR